MTVPTRTLASVEGQKRYPINLIDDATDTRPFFYLLDSNGLVASFVMNLHAMLRASDGKLDLANSMATDSITADQLANSIRPLCLGAPKVKAANLIVTAANLTTNHTTTYTIISNGIDIPRNVEVTIVDSTPSITSGLVTVAGLGVDGNALSEVFNLGGDTPHGVVAGGAGTYVGLKIFASVTSVTNGAVTVLGGSGDETLAVTVGNKIGLGMAIKFGYPITPTTNRYITSTNFLDAHTYSTFANQPTCPQNVTITVTDTSVSIVGGTITVNGTDQFGNALSEVFSLVGPTLTFTGAALFATLTSVVTSGVTVLGGAGDETFIVGCGAVVLSDVTVVVIGTAATNWTKVTTPVVYPGDFTVAAVDASSGTYANNKTLVAYVQPLG